MSQPVFIIGCHRSGTTLVRYLLDAHPKFACPPESKFIPALQTFLDYPQVSTALRHMGFTPPVIARHVRLFIESFLQSFAVRQNKTRWADKSPNNVRALYFIDEIFSREALYIFVVRHPLDCVLSLEEFFLESATHDDPDIARNVARYGRGRYGWAKYWADSHEIINAFAARVPARSHWVRYEELVRSPEGVSQALVSFLGEEYPHDLVEKAFTGKHTLGFQDFKILQTSKIHQESVGRWKNDASGELRALWPLVREPASLLGYSLED